MLTKGGEVSTELIEGMVYIKIISRPKITLAVAKEMVMHRHELINGTTYPVLLDAREVGEADRDAREFFVTGMAIKHVAATAFLVEGFFSKFIVNFFMRVNAMDVPFPVRVFSDEEKAVKWLSRYMV